MPCIEEQQGAASRLLRRQHLIYPASRSWTAPVGDSLPGGSQVTTTREPAEMSRSLCLCPSVEVVVGTEEHILPPGKWK